MRSPLVPCRKRSRRPRSSAAHGASRSTPYFSAIACGDLLVVAATCELAHGASAPSPIDSDGSGTTSSGSISICEPRPVQRAHAPCGELKEKIRGSSSGIDRPVVEAGELLGVERDRAGAAPSRGTISISIMPSASATAVSIESARRLRTSPRMTSRSTTTEMSCLNFLSSTISSSSIAQLAVDLGAREALGAQLLQRPCRTRPCARARPAPAP